MAVNLMALHEVTPDFKDRRMWRFCWNQKAVKSRHCALLLIECFNVPKWPCGTLILAVNTLMQCPVPFCLSPYFCIPSLVGNLLWRKVEGALCGLQFPRPHVWMCTSRPLITTAATAQMFPMEDRGAREEMEPFLEVAHQWRNWGGDYMRGMCPQSWRWGVGECSLPLPLLYLPCSAGTGIDFTGDWSLQGLSVLAGNAMLEASDWSLNSELSWFSGVIMIKKIGGE